MVQATSRLQALYSQYCIASIHDCFVMDGKRMLLSAEETGRLTGIEVYLNLDFIRKQYCN